MFSYESLLSKIDRKPKVLIENYWIGWDYTKQVISTIIKIEKKLNKYSVVAVVIGDGNMLSSKFVLVKCCENEVFKVDNNRCTMCNNYREIIYNLFNSLDEKEFIDLWNLYLDDDIDTNLCGVIKLSIR